MFGLPNIYRDSDEHLQSFFDELESRINFKRHGRVKKITYQIHNDSRTADSWRFNEWDYGMEDKIKLPTNARGLFTQDNKRIVVRGYDKFFAVDEVAFTKQDELRKRTQGPYELAVKENGCLILISGLEDGKLVICSKHSTGELSNGYRNHALKGEEVLADHLNKVNKSATQLGKLLYKYNLTALAEYCDDDFEEHIIRYQKDKVGLYLHGLNFNTIDCKTLPMDLVKLFADDWGFRIVNYERYDTFDNLWAFIKECEKTGTYYGREVEGFVIRCLSDNHGFFFKFKFEEPYKLYRQFREVTRKLIEQDSLIQSIIFNLKTHRFITRKYLEFVERAFLEHPELKQRFLQGHGIIELREHFIDSINVHKGIALLDFDKYDEGLRGLSISEYKYVLVSVATIGCGKTTVFQTLSQLFGWPHVQNDNVSKNSGKSKLFEQCLKELEKNDVVLLDKNNHILKERSLIFKEMSRLKDRYLPTNVGVKYVALNFFTSVTDEKQLWDITYNRIVNRGDNHQSIKAGTNVDTARKIMGGFINRFELINTSTKPDSEFDLVIDMNLNNNSSLENARLVTDKLRGMYKGLIETVPSSTEFEKAFKMALEYKPEFTKYIPEKRKPKVIYYGISVPNSIIDLIDGIIPDDRTWIKLKEMQRLQKSFHVTLAHRGASSLSTSHAKKWQHMTNVFKLKGGKEKESVFLDFFADLRLTSLVVEDDRLICIEVELLRLYNESGEDLKDVEPLNDILHITVGTTAFSIQPVESNIVLSRLHSGEMSDLSVQVFLLDGTLNKQQVIAHF